jgi:hypothetical protein
VYGDLPGHSAVLLSTVGVGVNPLVVITSGTKKPKHNKSFKIGVEVGPQQSGQSVQLQRQSGGKWHTVQTGKTNGSGAIAFTVKEKTKGSYNYRADAVGNNLHNDGTSHKLTVKVS